MGTLSNKRLSGKAAVVTGAASGLGLAVVRAMAAEGAAIMAFDRDDQGGRALVESLRTSGQDATFFCGDVTVERDIVEAIDRCRSDFGSLDIMHNNAALLRTSKLHETTSNDWQQTLDTNLSGVFYGCKHAVLAMLEQKHGGSIINTASVSSFTATPDMAAYVATKSGILGITRAAGVTYASDGIRCNAICPGDFESPMVDAYFARQSDPAVARRETEALYPGKRILKAAEVADVAVFLASDESLGVNATSIVVDGGLLAKTY